MTVQNFNFFMSSWILQTKLYDEQNFVFSSDLSHPVLLVKLGQRKARAVVHTRSEAYFYLPERANEMLRRDLEYDEDIGNRKLVDVGASFANAGRGKTIPEDKPNLVSSLKLGSIYFVSSNSSCF